MLVTWEHLDIGVVFRMAEGRRGMNLDHEGKGLKRRLKGFESDLKSDRALSDMNRSLSKPAAHAVRRKKLLLLGVAFFAFFILPMALGIWSGWHSSERKSLMRQIAGAMCSLIAPPDLIFAGKDRVNVLLIGRDVDRDRHGRILPTHGRADTIIVVSLCRSERKAYILSIPRDTAVIIDGHGLHKINAAHSFGGPELLVDVLRDQLCISVDYYASTTFDGLKKIVDAIGGVWLYVEKDMNYDDNWGNLHIHLKKGWQWLDGEKAHQYVRFRHDAEGDVGRTKRQRKFLMAVAARVTSPSVLPKLPNIIRTAYKHVKTNMTMRELMSLAGFAEQVDASQIESETLPGRPVAHYWLPDRDKAEQVLERMLGETFGRYMWDIKMAAIESAIGIRAARSYRSRSFVRRTGKAHYDARKVVHEFPSIPEESLPLSSNESMGEEVEPNMEVAEPPAEGTNPPTQNSKTP